jgi:hypothetical protein
VPKYLKKLKEAFIPPRGKQVPGVEINGQSYSLKTTIYEHKEFKVIRGKYIWIEIDFQPLHTEIMLSVIQLVKPKS